MRIGYASVGPNDHEGDLEDQETVLIAEGCARLFRDCLDSTKAHRPGLDAAVEHLRDGEDILVITRLDRLGRSLPEVLRTVRDLADREIGLKALDVQLDTDSASGKQMLGMLLTLAQWERDLLREQTLEGVARARAAGRKPGAKPKLDTEKVEAVRAAVAGGQPVAAVARSFGVSRPTVYKALQDGA